MSYNESRTSRVLDLLEVRGELCVDDMAVHLGLTHKQVNSVMTSLKKSGRVSARLGKQRGINGRPLLLYRAVRPTPQRDVEASYQSCELARALGYR